VYPLRIVPMPSRDMNINARTNITACKIHSIHGNLGTNTLESW
jgi:hypothetical protein